MANGGVNVKMGVSGVAQFKQNINTARNSLKTLDAQLALNEKQFKASGDAEAYMQEKSELLKVKLEEQKAVIEQSEKALAQMNANGVDKASKAFQDMQQQLLRAKAEMLDTEQEMQGVESAGSEAAEGVDDMNRALSNVGAGVAFQNVTSALDKITSGMKLAISKAWELGKAIARETLSAGEWADDLNTRATYFQISPERLQRIEKTARIIDTSVESIVGAKRKLEKVTAAGGDATNEMFAELGVILAQHKDPEDLFWETGQALMALGDEYKQENYAQKLFGKSWNELIPLFEAGREEYEKLNESWTIVPQKNIDALQEMDDKYQILQEDLEATKLMFLSELAPAVTTVMETLTGLVGKFNDYLQTEKGQEMMDSLSAAVTSLFDGLKDISAEDVVNGAKDLMDKITSGLQWIAENGSSVVAYAELFVAAWAGLEVAKGVTTLLQLVNGLKGLTASAGTAAGASWGGAFASAVAKAAPWLVGLYTLLNPAEGAGDQLDSLWDEHGNPTQAALEAGITQTQKEFNESPYVPDWLKREQEQAVQDKLAAMEHQYTGDREAAEERNQKRLANNRLFDEVTGWTEQNKDSDDLERAADKLDEAAADLTGGTDAQRQSSSDMSSAAGTLKGMPGLVESAILRGMSQIKIFIDGATAGQVLTPYVNSNIGGILAGITRP